MMIAECGKEANNAYLRIVYILLHTSDMLILDRHQAAGGLEAHFGVPANPTKCPFRRNRDSRNILLCHVEQQREHLNSQHGII